MDDRMWSRLAAETGCTVKTAQPLSAMTSFQIGGAADAVFCAPSGDALMRLCRRLRENDIPMRFCGNGTNLLVSDAGVRGTVVRLADDGVVKVDGERLICPAGIPLKTACRAARDAGLTGLEFAFGIPGTVGGAVYMNAGAYGGEMAGVTALVDLATPDGIVTVRGDSLAMTYRHSALMEQNAIAVSVTLQLGRGDPREIGEKMDELMCRRREKQPLTYPSAGSYFKRPQGYFAGQLIEQSGLKGFAVGGAAVSEKHAGFVINRDHATCDDVLRLEDAVRQKVFADHGVTLEREVQYWGD